MITYDKMFIVVLILSGGQGPEGRGLQTLHFYKFVKYNENVISFSEVFEFV